MAVGVPEAPKRARDRVRLSCDYCREKKIKCNRKEPCDQCIKHQLTNCRIIPHPQRFDIDAQARREDITLGLLRRLGLTDQHSIGDVDGPVQDNVNDLNDAPGSDPIIQEIQCLAQDCRIPWNMPHAVHFRELWAILPLGLGLRATHEELAHSLPPKVLVNEFVGRFIGGHAPVWVQFHGPSFLKCYEEIWRDPSKAPPVLLGLVFAITAVQALQCHISQEEIMGINPFQARQIYHDSLERCRQCLALAGDINSAPCDYLVETLMVFFVAESHQLAGTSQEHQSFLLSAIVRLAMHTGYNQDPKHFPGFSVFKGEMRRRTWLGLVYVDAIRSFQHGVHLNIAPESYDTDLPRNIADEDFDECTATLPPSRPLTEPTRPHDMLLMSQIARVFIDIQWKLYATRSVSYRKIIDLDRELSASYASVCEIHKARKCSPERPTVHLQRQTFLRDLLYEKSRCVLHKRFISMGRTDERFAYSRLACLDSAAKIMKLQYTLHLRTQSNGSVDGTASLWAQVTTHDFLLAAMVLCLELTYLVRSEQTQSEGAQSTEGFTKADLLRVLEQSREIWGYYTHDFPEACRAHRILSSVLNFASGTREPGVGLVLADPMLEMDWVYLYQQDHGLEPTVANPSEGVQMITPPHPHPQPLPQAAAWPAPPPLPHTWMSVSAPETLDINTSGVSWGSWAHQTQTIGTEMPGVPWNGFFPPPQG